MICLRFIEVAAQFHSMQKWGTHGPQEALTSPSQHTASPTPSTCIIIISDHIVYVWGWLREAYLRNGEEKIFHVQSAWVLPTLGSVRTPGDRMSVKWLLEIIPCIKILLKTISSLSTMFNVTRMQSVKNHTLFTTLNNVKILLR